MIVSSGTLQVQPRRSRSIYQRISRECLANADPTRESRRFAFVRNRLMTLRASAAGIVCSENVPLLSGDDYALQRLEEWRKGRRDPPRAEPQLLGSAPAYSTQQRLV